MTENVVRLDVREDILKGREPFTKIMSTVQAMASGDKLLLIAPFEPVPLYQVLQKKGFSHQAFLQPSGEWEVLFTPENSGTPAAPTPIQVTAGSGQGTEFQVDARGLEPPQPLVRILEALATLPKGAQLTARTDRRPLHLYQQLEERGYRGDTSEAGDGSFVTLIREGTPAESGTGDQGL